MKNRIAGTAKAYAGYVAKWALVAALSGSVIGAVGAAFGLAVVRATALWNACHATVFLAPAAGLLIVWLYHMAHEEKNRGTDLILDAVSGKARIPLAVAPLMLVSTVLSHAVSISTGREGAALQIGGSLGEGLAGLLRLDENDRRVCILCGMSACFGALFGTPLAAGFFPAEMVCVGTFPSAALLPCLASSLLAAGVAERLGLAGEHYALGSFPEFALPGAGLAALVAVCSALAGILLCVCLHRSQALYRKYFPNPYLRILAAGCLFLGLTLLFPERLYNGGGLHLIERCFEGGEIPVFAFLLKILFTAAALGAGFKGGEIVPSLCVGATLGCALAGLLGLPAGLCAGLGMMCVFVSVTNCPVATLFMAFELFGGGAMPYFALAVALSFVLSGYYSLYHSQSFCYSRLAAKPFGRED